MKGMCWVWGDGAERKKSFRWAGKRLRERSVVEGGAEGVKGRVHAR